MGRFVLSDSLGCFKKTKNCSLSSEQEQIPLSPLILSNSSILRRDGGGRITHGA